jgi:hypothetical protein
MTIGGVSCASIQLSRELSRRFPSMNKSATLFLLPSIYASLMYAVSCTVTDVEERMLIWFLLLPVGVKAVMSSAS